MKTFYFIAGASPELTKKAKFHSLTSPLVGITVLRKKTL